MSWRLIGFVVIFAVFLIFIGLNLENRCDISFGFTTMPQVPVYLTAFSAFVLGILWTIPFTVSIRRKKAKQDSSRGLPDIPVSNIPQKPRKGLFGRRSNAAIPGVPTGSFEGDDGSYGID
ncbi:MAG: hypothetical protein LBD78_09005 [Spirochaetaceae bacterium]|jgi:uncharacterized integral membrane protein|nr:hypothetical protein [Spirochaetaceae bacterium]